MWYIAPTIILFCNGYVSWRRGRHFHDLSADLHDRADDHVFCEWKDFFFGWFRPWKFLLHFSFNLHQDSHHVIWNGQIVYTRELSITSLGEVSLYGCPLVCFVWIQLLCLCGICNIFNCLVESKPIKQEVSCTVMLPLSKEVNVLWCTYEMFFVGL